MKLNWPLIGSDITAGLTTIALIPYDKDTMDIINHLVPPTWIPWIIKAGIASTLILRFIGRWTQSPSFPNSRLGTHLSQQLRCHPLLTSRPLCREQG